MVPPDNARRMPSSYKTKYNSLHTYLRKYFMTKSQICVINLSPVLNGFHRMSDGRCVGLYVFGRGLIFWKGR